MRNSTEDLAVMMSLAPLQASDDRVELQPVTDVNLGTASCNIHFDMPPEPINIHLLHFNLPQPYHMPSCTGAVTWSTGQGFRKGKREVCMEPKDSHRLTCQLEYTTSRRIVTVRFSKDLS